MSLVNNREETEVYLQHYGAKGMKWGVRKKYYTRKKAKATRRAAVQKGVGKIIAKGERKRGNEAGAKRAEAIAKGLEAKYKTKAAAAEKKLKALGPKPVPKPKKPMTAETKAKIELGATIAGALIGTLGTIAMWKFSAGAGKAEAATVVNINRLFTGG